MTIQEFSTSSPESTGIKFFVDNQSIIAMNVSSTACNGINTFDALSGIQTITVPINGTSYTFVVLTRELKTGYYFFTVQPKYINDLVGDVSNYDVADCTFVTFLPSANDATFETSDYNATIGNAIDTRLNTFFFDVDRVKNQTQPTNYQSIISGSANYAPVQDSNYSSIGFIRGRHVGTKTTSEDFGIDPALIATTFEGSVYTINKDDFSICSQSVSERPNEEYLFSPSLRYAPSKELKLTSGELVDALETPQIRYNFIAKGTSGLTFNSGVSSIELVGNPDIVKEDFLLLVSSSISNKGVSGKYEYLKILNTSYNGNTNILTLSIAHTAFSKYGDTSELSLTTSDSYAIFTILGDAIYKPNGGQIYRITDKKVYIPETNKIFISDKKGQLVYETKDCSI